MTIYKLWHEKEHTPHQELYQTLSFLFIQKSPTHKCQIWALSFFFLEGGKTFILAALLQFQEAVLIPLVARIETITDLKGVCLPGEGYLVWKDSPLCFVNCPSTSAGQAFPGMERENGISCTDTENSSRAECFLYLQPSPPTLKQVLKLFWSFFWSHDPQSWLPFCRNTCDTKISSYTASLGFRWQHKTSLVKK